METLGKIPTFYFGSSALSLCRSFFFFFFFGEEAVAEHSFSHHPSTYFVRELAAGVRR